MGRTRWEDGFIVATPEALDAHRETCARRLPFHDFQYGVSLPGGRTHWIVSSGYPVFDARHRFRGYRGLAREDSQRMLAEDALRRSEDRLAAIAKGSPVAMFALDAQGCVILWNRGCELLLGLSAAEMLGRDTAWRAFYGERRPVLADCVMRADALTVASELYGAQLVKSEAIPGALEAEGFFPALGGRERWLHFVAAPMRDDQDRIIGAIETLQDITERKHSEGVLRASERQLEQQRAELELAQRTARIGSWHWPLGAPRAECSPEMLRLLRVGNQQPVPSFRSLLRRVTPADRHKAGLAIRALVHRGEDLDLVCRFGRRLQTRVHMHILAVAERGAEGRIEAFRGTTQDITALQMAEAALRASSAMLTTIFEQSPLPLALIRMSGDSLLMANRAWHQHFVPAGEACTGRRLDEMGIWPVTSQWEALRAGLRDSDGVERFEANLVRFDGQPVSCEISGRAVNLDGEALLLASFVDVTEALRTRAEIEALNARLEERVAERTAELSQAHDTLAQAMEKLVQSEKLASLGGLVAGIAHELNTPLGNAMTVATTLRERVAEFAEVACSGRMRRSALDEFMQTCAEAAELLERNVERAARQVAQFKQVAVDQTSERRRRFDLRDTAEEIIATLRPRLRQAQHTVSLELDTGITLDSYPGPLEQVITNLIDNALTHAFAQGSPGLIRIAAIAQGGERVRILVSDDGQGMPAEVATHAFDPFFTTRLGSGGSGLGLYIVFNLVTGLLGGEVSLESRPGEGSRFTIDLPLRAPEVAGRATL